MDKLNNFLINYLFFLKYVTASSVVLRSPLAAVGCGAFSGTQSSEEAPPQSSEFKLTLLRGCGADEQPLLFFKRLCGQRANKTAGLKKKKGHSGRRTELY